MGGFFSQNFWGTYKIKIVCICTGHLPLNGNGLIPTLEFYHTPLPRLSPGKRTEAWTRDRQSLTNKLHCTLGTGVLRSITARPLRNRSSGRNIFRNISRNCVLGTCTPRSIEARPLRNRSSGRNILARLYQDPVF